MAIIGELAVLVTGKTQKFDRAMKRSQMVADRFGKSMRRMLVSAGIVGGVGFGIKLAMEAEKAQVAFEVMLKSATKASKTMADLKAFAAKTPFAFGDVQNAGRKLIAAQIPVEDLTKNLRMLGDIAAITDIRLGELASIFGKMKSGNLIQGEELNQLADRGLPIFDELATVLGTSADKIRKLGSEGKITFAHLSQAFQNLTGKGGAFFNATAKLAETSAGKWSSLKDAFQDGLRQMGKAFIEGVDLKKFIGDLTKLATVLADSVVPQIASAIQGLANIAKQTSDAFARLKGTAGSGGIRPDKNSKVRPKKKGRVFTVGNMWRGAQIKLAQAAGKHSPENREARRLEAERQALGKRMGFNRGADLDTFGGAVSQEFRGAGQEFRTSARGKPAGHIDMTPGSQDQMAFVPGFGVLPKIDMSEINKGARKAAVSKGRKSIVGGFFDAIKGGVGAIGSGAGMLSGGARKLGEGLTVARRIKMPGQDTPLGINSAVTAGSGEALRLAAMSQARHHQEAIQQGQLGELKALGAKMQALLDVVSGKKEVWEFDTTGAL